MSAKSVSTGNLIISGTSLTALLSTSVGSITGGSNTGSGAGLFSSTANANLIFKSLSAGENIMIRSEPTVLVLGELSGANVSFEGISGTTVTVDPLTNTILIDGNGTGAGNSNSITSVNGGILNIATNIRNVFVHNSATANLPSAIGLPGVEITIKSATSIPLTCTVSATVGTIDGRNYQLLTQAYTSATFVSDNSNWFII